MPQGVKLHAIIDACHSGSVMDLPFQAHVRGGYAQWESSYHYTRSHKVSRRGGAELGQQAERAGCTPVAKWVLLGLAGMQAGSRLVALSTCTPALPSRNY